MTIQANTIEVNKDFVGRKHDLAMLREIGKAEKPAIIIVYGRRRIGKTELLEQAFRTRNIIKFEGIRSKTESEQRAHILWQLSQYVNNPLIAKLQVNTWTEVFKLIYDYLSQGKWTLYFEEIQWLANYKETFISELKFAWDNYFKRNKKLILILCGSSPSFIIKHIVKSKSLYNRSQYELPLGEFSLEETKKFLKNRSDKEVMDAYLLVGGIPEYLKWLAQDSSVFMSLCNATFKPGSFFLHEYQRIFISSLADNKHYQTIIEFIAKHRFVSRKKILAHLKLASSGAISELLEDLESCGFIEKYTPYNLNEDSLLARYSIADNYLQFYYKFVKPLQKKIENSDFIDQPTYAIKTDTYYKWLGFAFERFCRKQHRLIAQILGFSAVHYRSGVFFNRNTNNEVPGYQFDLVFDRDDRVITLCEIKYLQRKASTKVVAEFARKLEYFPNKEKKTLHKVLITSEGADQSLIRKSYFDRIITLEEIMRA